MKNRNYYFISKNFYIIEKIITKFIKKLFRVASKS